MSNRKCIARSFDRNKTLFDEKGLIHDSTQNIGTVQNIQVEAIAKSFQVDDYSYLKTRVANVRVGMRILVNSFYWDTQQNMTSNYLKQC